MNLPNHPYILLEASYTKSSQPLYGRKYALTKYKEQTLKNIAAVLEASGSDFSKIVKLNVYLKDYKDFVPMNEVYITHFGSVKPVSNLQTERRLTSAKVRFMIGTHLRCGSRFAVQCYCRDGVYCAL